MAEQEAPQIELFMYSLNQEFPVGKGHSSFLKKRTEVRLDEKSGEMFTLQEVESQVYSKNRIEEKGPGSKPPKKEPGSGGGSPPRGTTKKFGGQYLASQKTPIPEFTPSNFPPDEIATAAAAPWTAQWAQNGWIAQWAQNTTYTNFCEPAFTASWSDPFENMKVREEDFGGILYNPLTDMVYKVNQSGFRLFSELQKAYRDCLRDLRTFRSTEFAREDVSRFVDYLRDQGIWEKR